MAGMGGPTSRFCHETAKQQISGEAVKCWSGDAGNRETNAQRPTAQRRIPNVECGRGARSGERGVLECWSVGVLSIGVLERQRSRQNEIGDRQKRAETKIEHPTSNAEQERGGVTSASLTLILSNRPRSGRSTYL